ncbi:MAG: hypothetical protein SOZ59_12555 [Candidatus Limivivens sp.]|nr:hypothetical protein [Candidatus Limivivens sp.]
MKFKKWFSGLLLLFLLMLGAAAQAEEESVQEYTIGVAVYDPNSTEMHMFINYYQNYIEEGFPVKFYFSEQLASPEDEADFIRSMKEIGARGIISFAGYDLPGALAVCEEEEVYYVLGSGIVSDENYEKVKDNPWFLGSVGPRLEDVHQTGRNMAEFFIGSGAGNFLIMTGGASKSNTLHALRTQGMLEVLQEKEGLVLEETAEVLARSGELVTLQNEDQSVSVTLCPDYTEGGEGLTNLETAFGQREYDVLMSAFHASTYLDRIAEKEASQGRNIMVGAIDSFTEENFVIMQEEDAFGNPPIDYVEGKYASMAGPAFAMLYNAMSGHPETNTPDGKAVRLYQSFWAASGKEAYIELYSYTSGIYENAYSCEDLMKVISVFHEDAGPEELKELAQACTVEDVKARILQ